MHGRGTLRVLGVAGHWMREFIDAGEAYAREGRGQARDLIHDPEGWA